MWLVTDQGFLSTVAYDPAKDRHNKRSNRQLKSFGPRPVLVRARREEHLNQLKPFWSKLKIEKDEYADYTFRAVMPRSRWIDFLVAAGDKIEYDSHFKEAVRDNCPGTKKAVDDFYSALMGVWSKLAAIQPFPPYGGWTGKSTGTGKGGATGGGYGSLYSGTGFSSYGGKTFTSGPGTPNPSGYTATGVKSAADSASVFLDLGRGSEGSLSRLAEEPQTVKDLAVMLLTKDPEEIFVTSTSDQTIGALFDEAMAQYGRKMTAFEVATILNELMNEPECPQYDVDEFYEAYDHLILNYEMPEVEDDADMERERPVAQKQLTIRYDDEDLPSDEAQSIATEAVKIFIAD